MAEELAINGGTPVRDGKAKIYYGKQWIDESDVKAVTDVLTSPYLTCGPKIEELEKKLCDVTGAKYVTAVSNGTAALHVACMAIGIKEGDEVIVSSLTFAASANCVLYCGGTPVFADVDERHETQHDVIMVRPGMIDDLIVDRLHTTPKLGFDVLNDLLHPVQT